MSFSANIWDKAAEEEHQMGQRAFIALLTFWVVAGLSLTAFGASLTYGMKPSWGLVLGPFMISLLGIFLAMLSKIPLLSLVGYVLVAGPFGLMMGPVVAQYTTASLINVVGTTAIMTVGLGGIGVIYPKSLESWGSYLFGALLLLVVGQFSTLILGAFGMPVQGALTMFDWIGVFLFSAYLIFDMNRAMHVGRTIDNSIDCALAVYLDVVNLFMYLLRLTGVHND